eukprot:101076_1
MKVWTECKRDSDDGKEESNDLCTSNTASNIENIQIKQRKILLNVLSNQRFADVTFIIGELQTEYHINRLFLSMISPVFEAMLFGQMKEGQPNAEVIIEDAEPEIFQCVINFAYCNDPNLTNRNILRLICFCDKYQITPLLEICHQYVRLNLNKNNFCGFCHEAICLKIFRDSIFEIMDNYFIGNWSTCLNKDNYWQFANAMFQLNLSDYIEKCKSFLQQSKREMILDLLGQDAFLKLKLPTMRWLLNIQPLHCCEEYLWAAVVNWAKYQSDTSDTDGIKLYLMKSVRDLIRFGLMDGAYFAKYVEPEKVLSDKELLNVLLYYQQPDRGCGAFSTAFRMLDTIQFTLRHSSMSWHYTKSSKYEDMIDEDLDKCMVTQGGRNQWIEARFEKMMVVSKMTIGSTSYPAELSGKHVQIKNTDGKWVDVIKLPQFEQREIREFELEKAHKCKAARLLSVQGHLNVGHWKLFGTNADRTSYFI